MGKLGIRKSKKRLRPEEAAEAIITSGPGTTMSLSAQTTPVNSSSGTTPSLSNSLPQISEEASDVSQDTRNSRKRSWVWKHFDEYTDRKVTKVKEYAPTYASVKKTAERNVSSTSQSSGSSSGSRGYMADWSKVVSELDEAVVVHEVDKYLLDPLEVTNPNEKEAFEFPILLWWRMNGPKYPVLAAIAKDVMAIQVSTVASESAFSTGGRVIDSFRSSLTPKSVEALICLQSWLRGNEISCIQEEPSITDNEFYEQCEREHVSTASSSNCPPPTFSDDDTELGSEYDSETS
ncbi:hypothetical protein ACLB2K_002812 [Fragaria x ananassa]